SVSRDLRRLPGIQTRLPDFETARAIQTKVDGVAVCRPARNVAVELTRGDLFSLRPLQIHNKDLMFSVRRRSENHSVTFRRPRDATRSVHAGQLGGVRRVGVADLGSLTVSTLLRELR